ncbi:hypothetical protein [uncultured Kocuria sp.]|uniref:hypothetical protein n=1 Tax=uncultured Kocuria sp. TaxID=259305 RepID=UPI0026056D4A|nr:hypothetical protein [uncultured Kocuria sp.]
MSFQFDNHKNLAVGHILTAPATYTPVTSFTLQPGEGALFSVNMPVTMVPSGQAPERNNAEIGYIDDIQGDEVFVVRTQEGTEARDVKQGWIILGTTTAKTLTDIESAIQSTKDAVDAVDTALAGKINVIATPSHIPATTSGGNQTSVAYAPGSVANSLVQRNADGQANMGEPTSQFHIATKNYVDSRILQGTGFPNGVVSAPVGSIYIDKAVTNGASSWIKKVGTGNTGWQVLEGDTGWRRLTLGTFWSGGNIEVRRIEQVVYTRIHSLAVGATPSGARTTAKSFLDGNFPTGFRRTASWGFGGGSVGTVRVNTFPAFVLNMTAPSDFGLSVYAGLTSGNWTTGDSVQGDFSFTSDDSWPTSLPGVAV